MGIFPPGLNMVDSHRVRPRLEVRPSRLLSSRRRFLKTAGAAAVALASPPTLADAIDKLPLPGGPDERPITTAFPEKGALILQRTRPPLLETPIEVFDQSVFTPNDRFYVRWHGAVIPTEIDVGSFRLAVRGHVEKSLSLSLDGILALPRVELRPATARSRADRAGARGVRACWRRRSWSVVSYS